jgi:uncharacterized membrane protein YecN with MAPEG domain
MLRGLLRWGREGSEEGVWVFCRVGLSLRSNGSGSPHPILFTHSEDSLSDFPYEKPDRNHLPYNFCAKKDKAVNNLPLTSIFTSLFTLFYLFLSFRIGYFRGSPVMKLLFRMDEKVSETKLHRNIRAHGNFSEYVPIFLVLLLIIESQGQLSFGYLLAICLIFSYGRLAHAICFAFYESNPFLRISGMICTYLGLGILAVLLLLDQI